MKMKNKKFKHGKNFKVEKHGVHIDASVVIGNNVKIYENVFILGNSVINDNVTIYPNSYISDCTIGENCVIKYSYLEGAIFGKSNVVGPFARVRPSTKTGDNVLIGNFVEIKNSQLGDNTKASHLSYVGDAEIGKKVNIGCGVIFVNFDGRVKHHTQVADFSFIGSNCNIIAPVEIGESAYICAGTTVTKKVEKGEFIIGRVRQETKKDVGYDRFIMDKPPLDNEKI